MRVSKIILVSLITLSFLNGANLDIKSNSAIFNKNLKEIKEIKSDIDSSSGREGVELNKYFHWEVLPSAFNEVIKADDEEGFKAMLELINALEIDINSFGEENNIYNIATEIIDNNSVKCMKALVNTNFDFDKEILDKNYKSTTVLKYAKANGTKEMNEILEGNSDK